MPFLPGSSSTELAGRRSWPLSAEQSPNTENFFIFVSHLIRIAIYTIYRKLFDFRTRYLLFLLTAFSLHYPLSSLSPFSFTLSPFFFQSHSPFSSFTHPFLLYHMCTQSLFIWAYPPSMLSSPGMHSLSNSLQRKFLWAGKTQFSNMPSSLYCCWNRDPLYSTGMEMVALHWPVPRWSPCA